MAPSFRLAKADHLSDIRSLCSKSMAYISDRLGSGLPSYAYGHLDELLEDRNLYILREDNRILATVALREESNCLYVDTLAVRKGEQGKGLGSQLLKEVEMIAESRGLPFVRLHTPEVMDDLVAYYRKRGYEETHRALPPHGRDLVLRVHFQKSISGSDLHMDPEHEHDRQLA
ncbi:GNAT family N-acetyltransferase [uncultured Cohaesibacter sp.]|uniref:GNAT family N-acetyltransferase n=1 Tax=uncultured Cohaesibacter sp. TaxID=1002546 RepID=UPI0029C965BD|nr:GNAT family N-acetyltransferase [uncultured Cohaesibacter sp.]